MTEHKIKLAIINNPTRSAFWIAIELGILESTVYYHKRKMMPAGKRI
jgi:DNA-binding CsgD family transcriptional regulator